jgi:hypothetical protein
VVVSVAGQYTINVSVCEKHVLSACTQYMPGWFICVDMVVALRPSLFA